MFRKILCPSILCSLFACVDPFTVDRHDLLNPRILGVRLVDNVYEVQVWNGVGVYHEVTPTVEWLSDNDEVVCLGVQCVADDVIPNRVRYIDTLDAVHDAVFNVQQSEFSLRPSWFSLPEDIDFDLDVREDTEGTFVESGLGTSAMRISMSIESDGTDFLDESKMRWMTAKGAGTFLELSAMESDFFRADITMDRDEVIANVPQDHDHATVFGLHIDGTGYNQWAWMDVWYETRPIIQSQNRWIAISEVPADWESGDTVLVTLSWDATQGDWLLTDPELTTDIPFSPACVGSEPIPFDWSALELGLCTIEDVDGVRVALETR